MPNQIVVSPHPPVIIPEIGGEETKKAQKTIASLKKLNLQFKKTKPETLLIITPHSLVYPDRFCVFHNPYLKGDFSQFGKGNVQLEFQNDLELVHKIQDITDRDNFPVLPYNNGQEIGELDHGALVPLYYLAKDLSVKVVLVVYSYLPWEKHYSFGQVLQEAITASNRKTAVIVSGDLSHKLQHSPYGEDTAGKVFDKQIIDYLKKGDSSAILEMDEQLVDQAGECGFRSLLIMLGILDQKKWQAEILAYEAPFGIGYLTARIKYLELKS